MSPHEARTAPGTPPNETPASEMPRTHVLTVDDQAATRAVCASFCDLFDHTSQTAGSAAEALAAMSRERFDVVVMNVHMQGENGIEALNAIRRLPAPAAGTPIIGLAAASRADEAQRWLAAGVAGLLAKPVTAARLFSAIQSVRTAPPAGARSWAPA